MPIEGRYAHPQAVREARAEGAGQAVGAEVAALRRERSRARSPGRRRRRAFEHHEAREGVSPIASRLRTAEQVHRREIKKLSRPASPGEIDAVEDQPHGGVKGFAELASLPNATHLEKARPAAPVGGVDVGALGEEPFQVALAPGLKIGLGEHRHRRRQRLEGAGLERARHHKLL